MTREQRFASVDSPPEDADELVDEWGEDSFPASDPPGRLPPSMDRGSEDGQEDDAGSPRGLTG